MRFLYLEKERGVKLSLKTRMVGLTFKNPLIAGCAGITEWAKVTEKWLKAGAGGVLAKTVTSDPKLRSYIRPTFYPLSRHGLKGAMTEGELLSTIPPDVWAKEEAPRFKEICQKYNARWIQSIVGRGADLDDWGELAQLVEAAGVEAIELDLGCPLAPGESDNYDEIELGEDPGITARLTAAVKKAVNIPVGIKLSPTIRRLDRIAVIAQRDGGADFCTAVNAPGGFSIDVENEVIRGANTLVGYIPGPSLKWWGIAKVAQIKQACDLEVSGCGGIFKTEDALEYILLGCPTVQMVSSLYFKGARVFPEILNGIEAFMERKGYNSINDFKGKLLPQLKLYKDVPHEEAMLDLKSVSTPVLPEFDVGKCNFCMQCVITCIHDAISADKDKDEIGVDDVECVGCGFCAGICPTGAISIVHAKTGKTIWAGEGPVDTGWIEW
jgi:dihydroorotate dehydrogenase subfamily 1|tara:strand:- start:2867 stop:4183 length:1317 start_codon:yes stop_codon:yes gene_type:complete